MRCEALKNDVGRSITIITNNYDWKLTVLITGFCFDDQKCLRLRRLPRHTSRSFEIWYDYSTIKTAISIALRIVIAETWHDICTSVFTSYKYDSLNFFFKKLIVIHNSVETDRTEICMLRLSNRRNCQQQKNHGLYEVIMMPDSKFP